MIKEKKFWLAPILLVIAISAFIYLYYAPKFVYLLIPLLILFSVSFQRPSIGMGLIIFAYPYLPDTLSLVAFLGLFCLYIANKWLSGEPLFKGTVPGFLIVIFVLFILYNTATSINPSGSFRDLALNLAGILFAIALSNEIEDRNQFQALAFLLVLSAFIAALYGLYQYKTGVFIEKAWLDVESSPDIKARVYSVFLNPNIFAEYLVMCIPIGVGMFWHTKDAFKKTILILMTLVMGVALILTMSRGGWIGIAFAAVIYIALKKPKLFLLLVPLAIITFPLLPATITNRILSIGNFADSSNAYRIDTWNITSQIIRDHWASGVGFGHLPFKQVFVTYIRTMNLYHSHNTFLQTAVEQGIPGLILFVSLIFSIFKYAYISIKDSDKSSYRYTMGSALIASLSGILLHGMVDNVLYIPRIIFTFWIIIGFFFSIIKNENI